MASSTKHTADDGSSSEESSSEEEEASMLTSCDIIYLLFVFTLCTMRDQLLLC